MTDKHDVDGNSSTNSGEGRSDSDRGQASNGHDDITDPGGRWQFDEKVTLGGSMHYVEAFRM
tara:strand:+ start:139 stop:324 length:186 start_codon:yes stop_codon:yes gene_type:complete